MLAIVQVVLLLIIAALALGVLAWARASRGQALRYTRFEPNQQVPQPTPSPRRTAPRTAEPQTWPTA